MKRIFTIFTACACFVLFGIAAPLGANAQDVTEEDLFEEIPVVFSASGVEERLTDAPAAISLITEEDIEKRGIVNLPDLFRYTPGMDVAAYGENTWGVSARGFNEKHGRRMLVLVDGMSVFTPRVSGVNWGWLPLIIEDIDNIEVVRGPNDTLYGFNAFNGAINIQTKDPKGEEVLAKYVHGFNGRNYYVGRYGNLVDLNDMGELGFRISYNLDESPGYGDNDGEGFGDKKNANIITSRVHYLMNDFFDLDVNLGFNFGDQNKVRSTPTGSTNDMFVQFSHQMLRANMHFSDTHNSYLQLYTWEVRTDGVQTSGGSGLNNDDNYERQFDVSYQDTFSLFDGISTTVLGASYRHNIVESLLVRRDTSNGTNTRQKTTDDLFSVFVNEKLILLEEDWALLKKLEIVAGVRAEWSYMIRNVVAAPRASLMYTPIENNVFRFTYAHANRLPSFVEEYDTTFVPGNTGAIVRILSNGGIRQEEVDSYELGYSGRFFGGKLELDADAYVAYLTGLVATNQQQPAVFGPGAQPQILTFNNSSNAKMHGLELEIVGHPREWIDLYANYTYEKIIDSGRDGANVGKYEGAQPLNKVNLGVYMKFKEDSIKGCPLLEGFSFNADINFRDRYTFFNDQTTSRTEYNIKKHTRLDMRVAKSFFDDAFEVAFTGNNLIGNGNMETDTVKVPQLYYLSVTFKGWPWNAIK